jgi:hypothetical protein
MVGSIQSHIGSQGHRWVDYSQETLTDLIIRWKDRQVN